MSQKDWPRTLAEHVARAPQVMTRKVQWGDMDALGHVNNVVYFQYLEDTRLELLEQRGVWPRLSEEGMGMVVADARCRYKAAVVYPDTLHLGLRFSMPAEHRYTLHYDLFSEAQQRRVAEAETLLVIVDAQGRPTDAPEWFQRALADLMVP